MSNRPKIKVPLENFDYIIELISITLLVLTWYYVISQYADLPETIASHFNAEGEADGYSGKIVLWLLPGLSTLIYVGLLILTKYPHIHNYMVNITEENALKNYRFSIRMLRIVNFLCVLLFAYIVFKMIEGARDNQSSLGTGFVIIVIAISMLLPIGLIIWNKKLNKS
ncbi:DUF1648 domain-containing protein [Winogradskyella sp. 3972H.M.0a.05]|uniref:DUF1648 domain-containing protein n=1 Tax=Winogradskyella sp. 3972H.M.0a.05 TaxID=2950277 RepID=UPI00339A9EEF